MLDHVQGRRRDCKDCEALWDEMKRADEQQLEKVTNHLKGHFAHGAEPKSKAA